MLEQRQKLFRRQPLLIKRRHLPQEAPRRSQLQRNARAVIGQDAPAVQRGGDLPGQHPVGGDEGGGHAVLRRLPQAQRDGQRLHAGPLEDMAQLARFCR